MKKAADGRGRRAVIVALGSLKLGARDCFSPSPGALSRAQPCINVICMAGGTVPAPFWPAWQGLMRYA